VLCFVLCCVMLDKVRFGFVSSGLFRILSFGFLFALFFFYVRLV
jgi:hypothetical protein